MNRYMLPCLVALLLLACDRKAEPGPATTGPTSVGSESSDKPEATVPGERKSVEGARALRDDGSLASAREAYRMLDAGTDRWVGELEIASLLRQTNELKALLDNADIAALDDATKRSAFLLAHTDAARHAKTSELATQLCKPAPGAADPALDTACARHALASGDASKKCVKGCDGAKTVGIYPAAYPIVRASIDGSEPLSFGVFGSTPMALTPETVKTLGLERVGEPFWLGLAGAAVEVHHVVADIELGDAAWENVPFVELETADGHVAGTIGLEALFERAVELDLSALELRLGTEATEGLEPIPMAYVDGTYAAWAKIGDRPARPFGIAIGNRALLISDSYHRAGTEFPIARTVQAPCAGDVVCARGVVQPFESKVELAGVSLDYRGAMIAAPGDSNSGLLQAAGYAGSGPFRGRLLRFDPKRAEFAITDLILPELSKGDTAAFTIRGTRVERPATLTEMVVEPGTDFVDIVQVFESEDVHEQFRIQVPETQTDRGGWLHTRTLLSSFVARPDGGTTQISVKDYRQAIDPYVVSFRGGPTDHIAPVDWTIEGEKEQCLELRKQAQVGPNEYGIIEAVQCPAAKWRVPLFRVSAGDEVIFEMRRDGAAAEDGAEIQ